MKAIIAAGGSGTRLRPLTFSSNKHLLPVANKPLLLYALEAVMNVGIKKIGVVVNETRPAIEALLGDGSNWGVKVTYIEQFKPLGLAHVVKICEDYLDGDSFVYHLGDNIFTKGIKRPYDKFVSTKADALLTIVEHAENYRLGVPYFDDQGNLIKVVEKPQNPPNKFGVPGLYFFDKKVFEAFKGADAIQPSQRGEFEITDLYTYLINHKGKVVTEEVDGIWMDPGKFVDLLVANAYLLRMRQKSKIEGVVDNDSRVDGVVVLGKGSRLINSQVVGPVNIGENCTIEDCFIGPDVSIADQVKMERSRIANSIVMQSTTVFDVEHIIADTVIGKSSEIWGQKGDEVTMFIGDHCKVQLA
jgi:glucose-1-phosphate thymidylyltransferase